MSSGVEKILCNNIYLFTSIIFVDDDDDDDDDDVVVVVVSLMRQIPVLCGRMKRLGSSMKASLTSSHSSLL